MSGRELDPVERQVERLRQAGNHQRLGESRHTDQEAVAPRQNGDEQLIEDHVLANDDTVEFLLHVRVNFPEAGQTGFGHGRLWGGWLGNESGRERVRSCELGP